ncbi:MAG: N-acetyltransferase [Bryobacterales bacterium]|nr:N-acetyltransferase [Bryobacterales bacterium]
MLIRRENEIDAAAIRAVHAAAFGQALEGDLVDALRAEMLSDVSLVAEQHGTLVGHALLSRVEMIVEGRSLRAAALGPVAVIPELQNQGIGSALISQALDVAKGMGIGVVVVLGHTAYYPRFGFSAERARTLASPYTSHGDAWMVAELLSGTLPAGTGTVAFPAPWAMFD